jgi:nucleoside-diphosphate-sugar epimerase
MFTGLPAKATGHYGVAKSTLFMAADAYRKQYKLKSILLVPTNLYGPWDKSSQVGPDLVRKFCRQPKAVEIWGTGRATRDFLYITDAAQGIVTACENPGLPTVPINLGSGVETPISELADRIRRLSGSEAEIVWAHSEPEGQLRRVLDIERAKNWLGWNPPTLLEDGLRATIHAFKHS